MESIQGMMVGAEVLGHLELPSDGAVKHATECDTIDRGGIDGEPYDPTRVLIHDANVVHQNPAQESAIVRCSKSSNFREGFWSRQQINGVPNWTNRIESSNTVTHRVKLAVKEDRSSTQPLRSDDAGHRVEETIESYFRLVEG
jgi:hypothetical protein